MLAGVVRCYLVWTDVVGMDELLNDDLLCLLKCNVLVPAFND